MNSLAFTRWQRGVAVAVFLLWAVPACAQSGGLADLDPNFRQTFSVFGGEVTALALQGDGKILVGGSFERLRAGNAFAPGPLVRLNADGTWDAAFRPALSGRGNLNALLVQPDGKIVVGSGGVERLLPDGTRDAGFRTAATGEARTVTALALQSDGKLIALGNFTRRAFDPDAPLFTNYGIVRLETDGSADRAFNAAGRGITSAAVNPFLQAVVVQPDGRIVIGGQFEMYNDTPQTNLARLNADGTLDTTFNSQTSLDRAVNVIVRQSDGQLLIGGSFQFYGGLARPYVARLDANGKLDPAFPALVITNDFNSSSDVNSLLLLPNGKLLVAGRFQHINDSARINLALLNSDGSVDAAFTTSTDRPARALAQQADGRLLLGGSFTRVANEAHFALARLQVGGQIERAFTPAVLSRGKILYLADAPAGKVYVAGEFDVAGTTERANLARLNADGTVDNSFIPALGIRFPAGLIALPDGRVIVAAENLNGFGYQERQGVVRLRADGAFEFGYDLGNSGLPLPTPMALQADGKLLVALFPPIISSPAHLITRYNADGTVDAGFRTSLSELPRQILAHPDGGVVVRFGGIDVTVFSGGNLGRVTRLRADGSNDADFAPFTGSLGPLALDPGNRVIAPFGCINPIGSTLWRVASLAVKNQNPGPGFTLCSFDSSSSGPLGPYVVLPDRTLFTAVASSRMTRALQDAVQQLFDLFNTSAILRQTDGSIVIAGNGTLIRAKFSPPPPAVSPVIALTSAANFKPDVAPGSLAAVFGKGLAAATLSATPPITKLGDTQALLIAADGQEKELLLSFVSDGQLNAHIPDGFPVGQETLLILRDGQAIGAALVNIRRVAPGIFTATGNGKGYAAALILRVRADGTRGYEPVVERNAAGQIVPRPIDLGPEGESVYLVLFGTGLRYHSGTPGAPGNAVRAEINLPNVAHSAPVSYAGEAPGLFGVDQINLLLPRALKGVNSDVTVQLNVDGLAAAATVRIL